MKISDLKKYEIPQHNSVKNSFLRRRQSVSIFKVFFQSIIDFALSNIIRIAIGIGTFKFLTRNVPMEEISTIQTVEQINIFVQEYNIILYAIISLLIALFMGSFYYVLLITYTEKGTIGTWITNLRFQIKDGTKPNLFRIMIWYIVKTLYPICAIACIGMFAFKGFAISTLVLFVLAACLSNIPSMMFGIRTPAEVFSSVKIVEYKK